MTWPTGKVADVAAVFNGKTPSKLEQREAGHPVLKIKDVDENGKFRGCFSGFVDSSVAEKHHKKKLLGGESLILNAAHNASHVASKTFLADSHVIDSIATGEWLIIRWNDRRGDPRFGNYWVNADETRFKIRRMVNGIHLYPKDVARLQLPLPPLAEQKRIAGILDAADALRAKRREAIAQLDTLLQSTFIEMFGDPRIEKTTGRVPTRSVKMGDLTSIRTGKIDANAADADGAYPFFTCAVAPLKINTPAFDTKAVLVAGNGDLNVKYYEGKFNAYQRTYVIEPRDASILDSKFLYIFLDLYVSELRKKAIGGVIKYIKLPYLTEAMMELPTIEEQRNFAAVVTSVEQQMARMRAHLAGLDALFASLQSRAFNGDL